MVDRPFLASQNWQQQQWRANREGAHPFIIEFERVFIKRMAKLGVPMFGHCVIRTAEEQDNLFALGNSRARAGQSPHNFGCAVDLVHSVKAWNLDRKQWALVGHVGKEIGNRLQVKVDWGGDWDFYDPAHWEIDLWKTWKDQYPWS